jgi:copper oxidase (laccase) domain-containing protein
VTAVGGCTIEQPDLWFSYRRDRTTGRHGGLVHL